MRQYIVFFIIGFIFIGMILLGRQPLLARVMSDEEKIITAIEHSFYGKGFCFQGTANLNMDKEIQSEIFQVLIEGTVNENLKAIELKANSSYDIDDVVICNYFENETVRYIITPIEGFKKILINKQQSNEKDALNKEQLVSILENIHLIKVDKNIPIRINQDTTFAINILTDCYTLILDPSLDLKELKLENPFSDVTNKIKGITIKIFIDEELQVRRAVGIFEMDEMEVEIEFYFEGINRENSIIMPDTADARVIKGSFEQIVKGWLQ